MGPCSVVMRWQRLLLLELLLLNSLLWVTFNFFVEKHAKGKCDGSFVLQGFWVRMWTETTEIDGLEVYITALEQGPDETKAADPPPLGPEYKHVKHAPEEKPGKVPKLDRSAMKGLGIEPTYCLRSVTVV